MVDSALCLFESQGLLDVMKAHREVTYPILVPAAATLGKGHWLESFQATFAALRNILSELAPQAYEDALKLSPEEHKPFSISQDEKARAALDGKWAMLHQNLQAQRPDFQEPNVPFKEDALPKDFNTLYTDIYNRVTQKF